MGQDKWRAEKRRPRKMLSIGLRVRIDYSRSHRLCLNACSSSALAQLLSASLNPPSWWRWSQIVPSMTWPTCSCMFWFNMFMKHHNNINWWNIFLHISKPLNNTETPTFHLLYSFVLFCFYKYTNMSKVKLVFPDNLWTALGEHGKSSSTAFAWIIAIILQELLSIIFHTVVHLCPPWTVIIMIHAKYGVLGYV